MLVAERGDGPRDDAGWEVKLAQRLLNAAVGADHSPAASVIRRYVALLPPADALMGAVSLTEDEVLECHEPQGDSRRGGVGRACERAREALAERLPHLATGRGAVGPSEWALGCVQSRAFYLGASAGQWDAGYSPTDRLAIVPFLDTANHADGEPQAGALNADFYLEADEDGERYMVLRAVAPIAIGDQVCIRYHAGMDAADVFATYGYTNGASLEYNCEPLVEDLPAAAKAAVRAAAAEAAEVASERGGGAEEVARCRAVAESAACEAHAAAADSEDARDGGIATKIGALAGRARCLLRSDYPESDASAGEDAANALRSCAGALEALLSNSPTTADADEMALRSLSSDEDGSRRAAILAYRLQRKRALECAATLVRRAAKLYDS
jgi:hypothetical protein